MKYILILLISFAFGQVTTISKEPNLLSQVPMTARTSTIGWMLKYAEECYNDSTIEVCADNMDHYKWRMKVHNMSKNGYYITNESEFDFCVIFKKQPTFEGFIEWLKNE